MFKWLEKVEKVQFVWQQWEKLKTSLPTREDYVVERRSRWKSAVRKQVFISEPFWAINLDDGENRTELANDGRRDWVLAAAGFLRISR